MNKVCAICGQKLNKQELTDYINYAKIELPNGQMIGTEIGDALNIFPEEDFPKGTTFQVVEITHYGLPTWVVMDIACASQVLGALIELVNELETAELE